MKRNILLINHYAGSPDYGMEYRPFYMAREWVRQGHQVTIAAATCSHVRQQQPIFRGSICEESLEGIRYVWLRTPSYQGNGWKRVVNMLSFVAQLYRWRKRLVGEKKLDAVIASSTYPMDIYPAKRFALQQKAGLFFEVHDLWPLSPIEIGGMSPWHPFIQVVQRAEDYAYRHADRVVSFFPKADIHMVSRGMQPDKFRFLPNGIDVQGWKTSQSSLPDEHGETIAQLKSAQRFLIGYAGGMGLSNSLDDLVDAAELLRDTTATFVLVGQGPEKERLRQKAMDRGLDNVVFLPPISKLSVPSFLTEMDTTYIGWRRCSLYRFGVSPNKLMDYMMAGKTVIHAIEAANDLVHETQCGISVAPEDPREIAGAVRAMMAKSAAELRQMGQRGKEYVEKNHDYTVLAQRFIDLIDEASLPQQEVSRREEPRLEAASRQAA